MVIIASFITLLPFAESTAFLGFQLSLLKFKMTRCVFCQQQLHHWGDWHLAKDHYNLVQLIEDQKPVDCDAQTRSCFFSFFHSQQNLWLFSFFGLTVKLTMAFTKIRTARTVQIPNPSQEMSKFAAKRLQETRDSTHNSARKPSGNRHFHTRASVLAFPPRHETSSSSCVLERDASHFRHTRQNQKGTRTYPESFGAFT